MPATGPFDIIVYGVGDSNNYVGEVTGDRGGDGAIDPLIDVSHPSIYQMSVDGNISLASEPLLFNGVNPITTPRTGFGLTLARDYYRPNRLRSGREILLVCQANAGTGVEHWRPGEAACENMIEFINDTISDSPGSRVVSVHSHIGANNTGGAITPEDWRDDLITIVDDFRTRVTTAHRIPWVLGGFPTLFGASTAGRRAIRDMIAEMPTHINNLATVDLTGLVGADDPTFWIHFTLNEHRTLAARHWASFLTLGYPRQVLPVYA